MSENLHFANCFSFKGLGNCNVMQFKMRGAGFGGTVARKMQVNRTDRAGIILGTEKKRRSGIFRFKSGIDSRE